MKNMANTSDEDDYEISGEEKSDAGRQLHVKTLMTNRRVKPGAVHLVRE